MRRDGERWGDRLRAENRKFTNRLCGLQLEARCGAVREMQLAHKRQLERAFGFTEIETAR